MHCIAYPEDYQLPVQRGNAASMLRTMKVGSEDEEFFVYKFCFMFYVLWL